MIEIKSITKSFKKFKALDNISLTLPAGQAVSLIGPNGSGKTTLIKSILGLVIPEKGDIYFKDKKIRGDWKYRAHIGYMPQIGRYPENMSIEQVINMIREIRSDKDIYDEDLIGAFHLKDSMHKLMRNLSGGTRQKVSACLAFLFSPEVLILDEPTAGLDPVSREILKEKIVQERSSGKLILITSHVLSDLEGLASHMVYLQEGKQLFYKDISQLQAEKGESSLNKLIAGIMKESETQHYSVK